jgi:AraC-like DNA-binding protein
VALLHEQLMFSGSADGQFEDKVIAYKDYLEAAQLPELNGIAARVMTSLVTRVGSSGLSASHIASDLNVSKRTLQRRLQQQDLSFTELRDRARFNYVLPLLVANEVSIDRLSSMLDFSDRTSFTLAFKRWTGLSPNTFRKLFRDYV